MTVMHSSHHVTTALTLALLTLLSGCCTTPYSQKSRDTMNLNHVVLISLADPADADECMRDCFELANIDKVKTIWVGGPVDTGRAEVDGDYEVGLCVGFYSVNGLQDYLQDPRHLELIETWKPRATRIRIFDVGDPYRLRDVWTQLTDLDNPDPRRSPRR